MDIASQLAPTPIADDAGVRLAVAHVEFLGIDGRSIADWRARRAPLGMSAYQYRVFCRSLFLAVRTDRLADLDVRLKGSAAAFYSGRHKSLPATWPEFDKGLSDALGRSPFTSERDDLRERVETFQGFQGQPRRRPFDSMWKLQLDAHPSDYDIQLSSRDIHARCVALLNTFPQMAPSLLHPKYGFLDDGLVATAVPTIWSWASRWTIALQRHVAVKAFGAEGPANKTDTIGELSSHFRTDDWILRAPRAGID